MPLMRLPDGGALAYDEYNFTDPWTEPETLVLVHGFSKNRRFWYAWIGQLARHYRVICVDQRGHGDSSAVADDFSMALRPFAQDLVGLLDGLSCRAAHFVMAEFTTSVALDLATAFPQRVRSLVLPGFGYNWRGAPVKPRDWVAMIARDGTAVWARDTNRFRLPAGADPALGEWYIAQQSRMPAGFLMKLFEFAADLDLTSLLPGITQPVLLLGGTLAQQDTADSLRQAERIMPDCRLVLFEGMPFNVMTACPEACVAATLEFLEQLRQR